MKLIIETSGTSTEVDACPEETIETLKAQVMSFTGTAVSDQRLLSGPTELLPNDSLLSSHNLPEGTVLTLAPLLERGSKKKRCASDGCVNKSLKLVGDCRWCQNSFCSKHRLPEAHACGNLMGCKEASAQILAKKLLNEKCVAHKV